VGLQEEEERSYMQSAWCMGCGVLSSTRGQVQGRCHATACGICVG
jgi:hypothetical protein